MALLDQGRWPGVNGFRVGRFRGAINTSCWLFCVEGTLIDSGPPNQWRVLRPILKALQPQRLVVTHHHEDHAGNAGPIARELGIPVMAPARSLSLLREGFRLQFFRRLVWGTPERLLARPLPREMTLSDRSRLEVIEVPGHSDDMTCLLEPDRGWLFSADLFVTSRPRYVGAFEKVNLEIESLRKVEKLDFDVLFCAHRGRLEPGRALISRKREYLETLRQHARSLAAEGVPLETIRDRLLGREGKITWFTRGYYSKLNLIQSCLER